MFAINNTTSYSVGLSVTHPALHSWHNQWFPACSFQGRSNVCWFWVWLMWTPSCSLTLALKTIEHHYSWRGSNKNRLLFVDVLVGFIFQNDLDLCPIHVYQLSWLGNYGGGIFRSRTLCTQGRSPAMTICFMKKLHCHKNTKPTRWKWYKIWQRGNAQTLTSNLFYLIFWNAYIFPYDFF